MAFTVNKKAFCVLEFAKTESIVTVQRRFRIMYRTEPPTDKTIREWYMKFQQSGCLCAAKRRGRPGPLAETVERVRETFVRSPQKSTTRPSRELQVRQKRGEILYLLICSFLPCLSWLLRSRVRKSRKDLWITLYFRVCQNIFDLHRHKQQWSLIDNWILGTPNRLLDTDF